MTFLLLVLGVAVVGTAAFMMRRHLADDRTDTPLATAANSLGLRAKSEKFVGTYRNYGIALAPADREGVQITVQLKQRLNGELRISGPSENAGSGTPEAKILTGNGNFDYHFWIIKAQPRDLGKQLLGELNDVGTQMVNHVPFGRWYIAGNTITYVNSTHTTDIATVADVLIALAGKIDEHDE